jgi:NADH dehydrogenase
MKVVITGANGAVGQAILRLAQASANSHLDFVAAVRSERVIKDLPQAHNIHVALVSYGGVASLCAALERSSAVIHLAGILVETPGSTYELANVETTRCVVEAAKKMGVGKIVYVSSIGADAGSPNRYWSTKGRAEAVVRESGCAYTILRVPLLLGPGTEGAAGLRRHLNRSLIVLPGGGRHVQQPLDVDDLARATLRAAERNVATNVTLNLVGPIALSEGDILRRAARVLCRNVRICSIPVFLVRTALAVRQGLGASGLSPDVLDVITADTQQDPRPAATDLRIVLTGIDDMINRSVKPIVTKSRDGDQPL